MLSTTTRAKGCFCCGLLSLATIVASAAPLPASPKETADDVTPQTWRAEELSMLAADSFDLFRTVELDLLRSRAIASSARLRLNEYNALLKRGHTSPQSVRAIEKQAAQAELYAETLETAFGFFEESLEPVWRVWGRTVAEPVDVPNVVEVPGVSFSMGGHLLFGAEAQLSPEVLDAASHYLKALQEQSVELRKAKGQLAEAREFAEKLRRVKQLRDTDVGLLNGKIFEAAYQIEKNRIAYNQLSRDLSRIELAHQRAEHVDGEVRLPWLTTSIAGLGSGWQVGVPLEAEVLKEALPLAIAKAQGTGARELHRANLAMAQQRLKSQKALYNRGSASEVSVRRAARDLSIARRALTIAEQEQDIAKAELQLLCDVCGIDVASIDSQAVDPADYIWELAIPNFVLDCRVSPTAFCGAASSYIDLIKAQAEVKVAAIEVDYRESIQKRLAGAKFVRESELKEATYLLQATRAAQQEAVELMHQKFLELRQWSRIHKQVQDRTADQLVYGISPAMMQRSLDIAKKRENLARLQSENLNSISDHREHVYSKLVQLYRKGSAFEFEATRSSLFLREAQGEQLKSEIEQILARQSSSIVAQIGIDHFGDRGVLRSIAELKPETLSTMLDHLAAKAMANEGELMAKQARHQLAADRADEMQRLHDSSGAASAHEVALARQAEKRAAIELDAAQQQREVGKAAQQMFKAVREHTLEEVRPANVEPGLLQPPTL